MNSAIEAPHPRVMLRGRDPCLLPTGLRRLTIALYTTTACCVGLWLWRAIRGAPPLRRASDLWGVLWVGTIAVYSATYAITLHRARPRWVAVRRDMRPYAAAFGDGPLPAASSPGHDRRHTALLLPFLVHAAFGLAAALELVLGQVLAEHPSGSDGSSGEPLRGLGLLAGFLGLLLGWMPAVALANSTGKAGWLVLVGILGPLVVLLPLLVH